MTYCDSVTTKIHVLIQISISACFLTLKPRPCLLTTTSSQFLKCGISHQTLSWPGFFHNIIRLHKHSFVNLKKYLFKKKPIQMLFASLKRLLKVATLYISKPTRKYWERDIAGTVFSEISDDISKFNFSNFFWDL